MHIARAIYLYDGSLRERMCFTNHGSDEINMTLSLAFASDFADIFEVRGIRRERRGESWAQLTQQEQRAPVLSRSRRGRARNQPQL